MKVSSHADVARLLTRLATALVFFVALTPVSIFGLATYFSVAGLLDSNLRLQAIAVEQAIHLQPDYWELNPDRLNASFERYVIPGQRFQIIDRQGKIIVEIGQPPIWPSLVRGRVLHDFGREVGRIEAAVSVLDSSVLGLALFCLSLGAAWLIWNPLRRLPLAALASSETAIRLREQYQSALLDNFPFAVWLKDTEGRFLSVNTAFARTFGVSDAAAVVGKSDFDIAPRDIAERYRADDRVVLSSGQKMSVEEEILTAGSIRWFETYKAPVLGDHAEVVGTVGFARDITERKRGDRELERYRNQLEALVEERSAELQKAHKALFDTQFAMDKVGIGIRRADFESRRIDYVNRAGAEMLGYTVEEMLALSIQDIEPNFDPLPLDEILLKQGQVQFEAINRTKDGRFVPVEVNLHYNAGDAQTPAHVIAFVTDITQRKQAEAHLRRLSQAVERSLASIVIIDSERIVQYVNPAFSKTSGYAAAEVIGKTPYFVRSAVHDAQFYEELWQTISHGGVWLGEIASRRSNGELYWSQASISPILSQAGRTSEIVGYVGIMDDITKRKMTLMRLQESEERFRQAFVHAPFGVAVVAIDGQVREANPALCRLLGYDDDQIKGLALRQFFLDDQSSEASDPLEPFADGRTSGVSEETVGVHRDGGYIPVIRTLSLVRDANNDPLNFIVQIEDISERKQGQLKDLASGILAAQERERARLSHELHDEIGQSLTALKMTLKRAQQNAADPSRIERCLNDGQHMLEHLMDEVRSIAYRLRPSELDQLGLVAALRSHLDKTIRPLGQKVTLFENIGDTRLPAGLELCCFRVVQEALTNGLRHAQAPLLEVSLELDASQLTLSVKDQGLGFDVGGYYSSQERPSSLGLIGMRERVAANGGQLQIRSLPGQGTEVIATFAAGDIAKGFR